MKIKIDKLKCKNPDTCMKCIQICPVKIFVLQPIGAPKMSSYVKTWRIKTICEAMCNGCMECAEICPEQCIRVEF
jgi:ferredoxin